MKRESETPGTARNSLRIFLLVLGVIGILAAGSFIVQNRSQPSETEYVVANDLVTVARSTQPMQEGQSILFDVSRNHVSINAYGFIDSESQGRIEKAIRARLVESHFDGNVDLAFFPTRRTSNITTKGGATLKSVEPSIPLKSIHIAQR